MTAAADQTRTTPDGRLLVLAQMPATSSMMGTAGCDDCAFYAADSNACPVGDRRCGSTGVWVSPSDAHREA